MQLVYIVTVHERKKKRRYFGSYTDMQKDPAGQNQVVWVDVESTADHRGREKQSGPIDGDSKKRLGWSALLVGWLRLEPLWQQTLYIWMLVDTSKCLKLFSVHLKGMSRRLNLLWGCVSSLNRGCEALSKMKISSVSSWWFFCTMPVFLSFIFRRRSTSCTVYHSVTLSFGFLMWTGNICVNVSRSASQCLLLIYLAPTVVCISRDRWFTHDTRDIHEQKQWCEECVPSTSCTDLSVFSVRWSSRVPFTLLQLFILFLSVDWVYK